MMTTTTIRDDLRRAADQIRVKLHLAGMEAQTEWERLEPKLREFERKAGAATERAAGEVRKLGEALMERLQQLDARITKH